MTNEPPITPELIRRHNLTSDEHRRIVEILGREPTYTELGIFSVMWSEHCSYKSTKPLLKRFPTRSRHVLVSAGEENAGIIDIGDGLAVAFKIESHNHPSAVEPFQGAATGVGGIIRDIFTMGARPVAAINSLRFGPIAAEPGEADPADIANNRRLFRGVVAGIAHYGNCFGIPTIAGEVAFDPSYEGNPLVNAFCLGVLRHDQIARGSACGIGNPVFYVGPPTGRDGLAGAAFASQDLTDESAEQQRGAVQIGDPFMEKLVLEACLELLATGAVAGIQDMGAAGLTCSTCETAARAGTGIEIELDRVPQRAPNMTPYEIMLSESQERMLIIVHRGREAEVQRVFDKWDLPWAEIGAVTDTGRMVAKHHGRVVANIPARLIASESPVYQCPATEPAYLAAVRQFTIEGVPDLADPIPVLPRLLAWPTIASKNWVYRQYDHMVRAGSVVCPGSDAAVVRIKADSLPEGGAADAPTFEKFVALTVDGNAAYVYLDPFEGAKIAVAEAARNLACSGASPLGVTDNLNFGNPSHPEIFYQLERAVAGLAEACRSFGAPVTGGNVSLYNQNPTGAIDPTPTVAMVGIIDKPEHITTQWFRREGDAVLLLGDPADRNDPLQGLGGSAYLQVCRRLKTGTPPRCDLDIEKGVHQSVLSLIRAGLVRSAHDCSEGGLAVALAEACISRQTARNTPQLIGAEVEIRSLSGVRLDALLFGESQGRIIVSVDPERLDQALAIAIDLGVAALPLGRVGGDSLVIRAQGRSWSWPLVALHDAWWNSIGRAMR
ncbi:MAG TPA: phosphoribosylformylglycinamidine synthase subunit PurL [Candidatus Paceibacterota bacterium]|nr:phosphoribosylformylglycinamidine synthase subunit PurL [Verrucomicrobiota bacterium]HRZ46416.1 phosphoribosylformylglycinamidine synthase subunit PurL [Candidatus Paceibacterota bacterium]